MAIIQYSRNRGKPWGGHPLVTMVTSAIRGKGLFCWKWSRHQERALEDLALLLEIFKKTIRQWFKTLLKIGLRGKPSDLTVRRPFFIIDEVGFCKIEGEGQATQGKQHPRNLIWCYIGENLKWSRCQFTFSISFHARPQTRNFQRPTQEHGTKIRGGAVKVITFLQSVCQS